jgi:hypothetical protein
VVCGGILSDAATRGYSKRPSNIDRTNPGASGHAISNPFQYCEAPKTKGVTARIPELDGPILTGSDPSTGQNNPQKLDVRVAVDRMFVRGTGRILHQAGQHSGSCSSDLNKTGSTTLPRQRINKINSVDSLKSR